MNLRLSTTGLIGVVVINLLLLIGLTYGNFLYTSQNPDGSEFLSLWVGTRLFLTRGFSPYGEQVARQVQELSLAGDTRPSEGQMLFAYPLYGVLIVAPFALIAEYSLARALWMTVLEVSLILIAFVGISLSRWKPPRWLLLIMPIFSLLWYYGLQPVINGNLAIEANL